MRKVFVLGVVLAVLGAAGLLFVVLRPASIGAAVGPWYDSSGAQLPQDRWFVMEVERGPEHCQMQDAVFLYLSWPLGSVVYRNLASPHVRMFVRNPIGSIQSSLLATIFDPHATIPPDAEDTGFHRNGWDLWVSDRQISDAVWLVHSGTVERWPAAKDGGFACF